MSLVRKLSSVLVDYSDPESFSSRLSKRRIGYLTSLIAKINGKKGSVRIIDVGGSRHYWSIVPFDFLKAHNVTITVVNLPGEIRETDDDIFAFADGNGCDLKYDDLSFDLAHSNSVIEHVGRWKDMKAFAANIRRISKITTFRRLISGFRSNPIS